jgi:hypothetical protein
MIFRPEKKKNKAMACFSGRVLAMHEGKFPDALPGAGHTLRTPSPGGRKLIR